MRVVSTEEVPLGTRGVVRQTASSIRANTSRAVQRRRRSRMMAGAERPLRDAEAGKWEKIAFGNARNLVKSSVEAVASATA
jgi:hypothetical protein